MRRYGIALLFLVGHASADDLFLKQGGRPFATGVKVVEEVDGKVLYLDKQLKKRSFSASMIGRIERKRCDIHEYEDRLAAARDADALVALAVWAKSTRFHRQVVRNLYLRALELDRNNETANEVLGRVQHEGEWMTPAEREKRVAEAEAAAMRARGLVRWKDGWITPEDKAKLEQGLRKYKGRWLTEDEIKLEQGFVKHQGKWVKRDQLEVLELMGPARRDTGLGDALKLEQSEHFAVMGDLPAAQLQQLAQTMERLYGEWLRVFPGDADSNLVAGKYRMFAFKKSRPYQRLVKALYKRQKAESEWSPRTRQIEERRMKMRLRETSFWEISPHAFSAHVQMPDPFEGLRAHCVHFGANVLATRSGRLYFPTWWLNEGLAYYLEKKVTGTIQTFNADVGGGGYANSGPIEEAQKNPWIDFEKWMSLLGGLVRANRDPKLEQIKGKDLFSSKNRMTVQDLAKSLSVVTFLIQDDVKKFARFLRDAKEGRGSPVERETAAMLEHYGSYRKVEERWNAYARNGFRIRR